MDGEEKRKLLTIYAYIEKIESYWVAIKDLIDGVVTPKN